MAILKALTKKTKELKKVKPFPYPYASSQKCFDQNALFALSSAHFCQILTWPAHPKAQRNEMHCNNHYQSMFDEL